MTYKTINVVRQFKEPISYEFLPRYCPITSKINVLRHQDECQNFPLIVHRIRFIDNIKQ
jgi:hypothetical protein